MRPQVFGVCDEKNNEGKEETQSKKRKQRRGANTKTEIMRFQEEIEWEMSAQQI